MNKRESSEIENKPKRPSLSKTRKKTPSPPKTRKKTPSPPKTRKKTPSPPPQTHEAKINQYLLIKAIYIAHIEKTPLGYVFFNKSNKTPQCYNALKERVQYAVYLILRGSSYHKSNIQYYFYQQILAMLYLYYKCYNSLCNLLLIGINELIVSGLHFDYGDRDPMKLKANIVKCIEKGNHIELSILKCIEIGKLQEEEGEAYNIIDFNNEPVIINKFLGEFFFNKTLNNVILTPPWREKSIDKKYIFVLNFLFDKNRDFTFDEETTNMCDIQVLLPVNKHNYDKYIIREYNTLVAEDLEKRLNIENKKKKTSRMLSFLGM